MHTIKVSPEVFGSLENGIVPNKLSYKGHGADLWIALDAAWSQSGNTSAERALLDTSNDLFERWHAQLYTNNVALVDFGCGSGETGARVLEKMKQAVADPQQYVAVDISKRMIRRARSKVEDAHPGLHTDGLQFDFDNDALHADSLPIEQRLGRLGIFVGNTVGNYPDPTGIIRNINGSLRTGDQLLVGSTIPPETKAAEKSLVHSYKNPAELELLADNARRIGIDIPDENVEVKWDQKGSQIIVLGVVAATVHIANKQLQDSVLTLRKGSTLQLLMSKRYTPEEMDSILKGAQFEPTYSAMNEARSNQLTLATAL